MTVMLLMIVDVISSSTTTVPKTCKTYTHTYIYIYIRATPGLCPSLAAKRVTIPNQMLLHLYIQLGRSTKVLGTIKIDPR